MYLINIRNFFYRSLLFVFLEEKVIFPPPRPSENLVFLLFITVLRAYKAL